MMNIGWIGLGAMGAPMAGCLARSGHQVTAFDVDPARAPALAGDGVHTAGTVTQAATDADVLAVMVATADQAESVLFGEGNAVAGLRPDATVLVMATVGAGAVTRWAERLGAQGIDLVDAPVSGGVARAASGDLLIMVSGSARALDRTRPILDALASIAPVVGPRPGDGQRMKLVNQLLCGVHIAVAAEAIAFAESLGLDAASCYEVLRHGAATSFMFEDRGQRMVDGTVRVNSALNLFVKDMGLVVEAARDCAFATPLASTAQQLYLAGQRAGLGARDDSSIVEVLRGAPR